MRYSKGIMWLDDCRIPTTELLGREQKSSHNYAMLQGGYNDGFWDNTKGLGRFTPNLLVCDDMLNDGVITKQSKRTYKPTEHTGSLFGNSPQAHGIGIGDTGSSSRYYDLDMWFNKLIDEINYVL
jgi:hypothetical protein